MNKPYPLLLPLRAYPKSTVPTAIYNFIINPFYNKFDKSTVHNQIADGHPTLKRLSDNSISEQRHVKNKVSEAFKSKKKGFIYYQW
jgi:hypothetical protein